MSSESATKNLSITGTMMSHPQTPKLAATTDQMNRGFPDAMLAGDSSFTSLDRCLRRLRRLLREPSEKMNVTYPSRSELPSPWLATERRARHRDGIAKRSPGRKSFTRGSTWRARACRSRRRAGAPIGSAESRNVA